MTRLLPDRTFTKLLAWIVTFTLAAAVGVICLSLWLAIEAAGADINPACMTREQARAKYPRQWLYWHTPQRCWDNKPGRSRSTYAARAVRPPPSAPPFDEPTALPSPKVYYPDLTHGSIIKDFNLMHPHAMTTWPLIIDFDAAPFSFGPWQQRIEPSFGK